METEISKDIREYTESVYFGLNLRQFVCSILGIAAAVVIWMTLQPWLGTQLTSWLCCFAVAPFAAVGFVKWNGQTFEQMALAWFKFAFLSSKQLKFRSNNLFVLLLENQLEPMIKEEIHTHENTEDDSKA